MKRIFHFFITCILLSAMLFGCSQSDIPQVPQEPAENTPAPAPVPEPPGTPDNTPQPSPELPPEPVVTGENLSIVTTIFPQYDWVCQILGEKAEFKEITLLINNRIDLHSYQPSIRDITTVSTCDLFIYIGGESDDWVEAVLEQAINPDMVVIKLMDVLGDRLLVDEEIDDGSHHHHHHHDDEYDEHVWLSLRNAVIFANIIANALADLDPELADYYKENADLYSKHLHDLDDEYTQVVSNASRDTLLFADRFPFRYLLHDYDLNFYAAFSGCSAETEASFKTITFLAKKLDELGLTSVMVTESANVSIAETVIGNSSDKNQKILILDSMQSSNENDRMHGVTYLSVMESNLNVLKEALN